MSMIYSASLINHDIVMFLGGTLKPFDIFVSSLFPKISSERITYFSCGHIAPSSNILSISLSQGIDGKRFDFTYKHKYNEEMLSDLLFSLVSVCRVVPNGFVVFFTSYAYMDHVLRKWSLLARYNELKSSKTIFIEPKDAKDTSRMWSDYSKAACNSGALLFCVVGGKLSEGINFTDHLARCVAVIGMPYPDIRDPLLQEKMKYADGVMTGGGKAFYDNICMKAVNQSIGRSIRHINDYASILLFDERYCQLRVISQLPDWIRKSAEIPQSFEAVIPHLKHFYLSHGCGP